MANDAPENLWLKLARSAYSASTTYFDASVRPEIESAIRQFYSIHPAGSKYNSDGYRARSKLYRPKTRSAIRKNEAIAAEAFFTTNDLVSVTPSIPQNNVQQLGAKMMQALLQHRLTKSIPWFLTLIGAYQEAMTVGVVASHQYWEYDVEKGIDRPCIKLIPVENLRIDPAADWTDPINSSPYVIRMVPMYVKDVVKRMTVPDGTGKPKWIAVEKEKLIKAAGEQYDSIRQIRVNRRQDPTSSVNEINDYTIVWVHQNVIEYEGVDYLYYTLSDIEMLSEPVKLKNVYHHGSRPFVMGYAVIEAHKVYPAGLPGITKDLAQEMNTLANQRIDNINFVLNKRYFVKRHKQVDVRSLTRNSPSSATFMEDPEKDVKVIDTGDVTSSAYAEQDRLNLDFDDVAGTFSGASVQSNRRMNETVGGMNILTANSNQVGSYQLRTFVETWVEPVLRQLMALEREYETDDVILNTVADAAGIEDWGAYGDLLAQDMQLTVNVGMGATNSQDKINNLMFGIGAVRTALQDGILLKNGLIPNELIKEIFGKLGWPNGGRFFTLEQEDRTKPLIDMIQQLEAELEAKRPKALIEAEVAKTQAEIKRIDKDMVKADAEIKRITMDSVRVGVEAAYGAMQAGRVVALMPLVAPVADRIMQAAGYVPPTPPGVDPNFPAPGLTSAQADALLAAPQAAQFGPSGVPENTSPMQPPVPQKPYQGIETPSLADNVPGGAEEPTEPPEAPQGPSMAEMMAMMEQMAAKIGELSAQKPKRPKLNIVRDGSGRAVRLEPTE